jgi:Kef-type K+ transport system membrane component KefB
MEPSIFYYLSTILVCGLLFGRFAKILHLPNVTGYLIGGLLIGPYMFGLLPELIVEEMSFVSELALGFIAFTIGSEFKFSYFKRVGITPIVIAVMEALLAVVLVFFALIIIGVEIPFALVLSAIAAATAPAATVMVIKQYKAKGPVTETLLSVVAIDDAVALIIFGLNVAIAKAMTTPSASLFESILTPVWEISISIGLGILFGFVMTISMRFFKSRANRFTVAVAGIFVTITAAQILHGSSLLMVMAMSAAFANLYRDADLIMELSERATPPIFMMFFVVSGAHLNLAILPTLGWIGTIYVLFRVLGKWSGAYWGASIMKASDSVKKYLGPALIPQAGVAIGLTFVAQSVVPQYAGSIRAIILCATLIYELIGPAVAKLSLQKAGEIVSA